MRKIGQIEVEGTRLFALCEDGTVWVRMRIPQDDGITEWSDWEYITSPPEGTPPGKPMTLEEQADHLRTIGNQTFVGRGHHLHPEGDGDKK